VWALRRCHIGGLKFDKEQGSKGWSGLEAQVQDGRSYDCVSLHKRYHGETKGVEVTHRGCYMAAIGECDRIRRTITGAMSILMDTSYVPCDGLDIPVGCQQPFEDALLSPKD
jgi:hypothetical protein